MLRFDSWKDVRDTGTIYNALTMEERCEAIKLSGGTFFENPEDSEYVRPLLQGFGNREPRTEPMLPEDGGSYEL